jgi:hypothetical protein
MAAVVRRGPAAAAGQWAALAGKDRAAVKPRSLVGLADPACALTSLGGGCRAVQVEQRQTACS